MSLLPASSRGASTFFGLRSHIAGAWVRSPGAISAGGASQDQLYLTPVLLFAGERFDLIACETTAAGGVGAIARLGIYLDDGASRPGALLSDFGVVATDTAAGVKSIAIVWTVPATGLYWLAITTGGNANPGTFRQMAGESFVSGRSDSLAASYGYGVGNVVANGLPPTMVGSGMSANGTFAMVAALRAA